jgi:uncharacterized protein YacL
VQDGSDYLGTDVQTSVTKVLQTAAGRMVFAKPEQLAHRDGNGKKSK